MRWALIRDPQGTFTSQAVLCTDYKADPTQVLEWFVMRWSVEVTFHEGRTHLGVETPRHWSDMAMVRTTPALLGRFSLVTIVAHQLLDSHPFPVRQAARSSNALPPFSDMLAVVRLPVWASYFFCRSSSIHDVLAIPRALFGYLVGTLAFAS